MCGEASGGIDLRAQQRDEMTGLRWWHWMKRNRSLSLIAKPVCGLRIRRRRESRAFRRPILGMQTEMEMG